MALALAPTHSYKILRVTLLDHGVSPKFHRQTSYQDQAHRFPHTREP